MAQQPKVDRSPDWIMDVTESRNIYGVTWVELMLEMRKQVLECESADDETNHITAHDLRRLEADLAELRAHERWALERPERDWPRSRNRMYKIEFVGTESTTRTPNRFIRNIGRLIEKAIQEASESDSMNKNGALVQHDVDRVEATWQEIEDLIKQAKDHSPKDQPAVTPSTPRVGPGSSNSDPEHSVTFGSGD